MHYMPSLANPDWSTSAAKETLDRPRRSICYGNETGEVPEEDLVRLRQLCSQPLLLG